MIADTYFGWMQGDVQKCWVAVNHDKFYLLWNVSLSGNLEQSTQKNTSASSVGRYKI